MKSFSLASQAIVFGFAVGVAFHQKAAEPIPPHKPAHKVASARALPIDCRKVKDERTTLACTVYFEARNQPFIGQVAVAKTVVARVEDQRYPDSIHAVVWQAWPSVQFAWTVDERIKAAVVRDKAAWKSALKAASIALSHSAIKAPCDISKVLRYHTTAVAPAWPGYEAVCQIGDHIFYAETHPMSVASR